MINNVKSSPASVPAPAVENPGGKMGKNEFLKLFVAQIRHQDPLNPMQGDQLASQLAQFSSVEQLIAMNAQMETQNASNRSVIEALHTTSAMGMLGKTLVADGDAVLLGADGSGSVTAEIGNTGGAAKLRLFDSEGKEVGSRTLGNVAGGRQTFPLGTAAQSLKAGAYTYTIEVSDGSKTPVPVRTFTIGQIDGVRSSANGPVLTSGKLVFPFGSIVEILDSAPATGSTSR